MESSKKYISISIFLFLQLWKELLLMVIVENIPEISKVRAIWQILAGVAKNS